MEEEPSSSGEAATALLAERRLFKPAAESLDLRGCLNRYGPPDAVLSALRNLSPSDLRMPSGDVAARLELHYAEALGVDPAELVVGRDASDLLRTLSRQVPHSTVAVPLPASVSTLRMFPGRGFAPRPGEEVPSLRHVDEAMDCAELVVIANPHELTGSLLDPEALAEIADRHPASTLVVDESLIEFLPDPSAATVIGVEVGGVRPDNVIALRSSSAFYGMGASRTGAAWCRDGWLLGRLFGRGEESSLSGLDAVATEAALADGAWAAASRRQLADDGRWLARVLAPLGRVVDGGTDVPFRCVVTERAPALADGLAAAGVRVRLVGPEQGVWPAGLWVSAPPLDRRGPFAGAVEALRSGPHLDEQTA